jgi:hypothetical protein
MKTEQPKSKTFSDSKTTFVAGMFYTCLSLTVVAFLLHVFGLDWFASTVEIPDPDETVQKAVKASLLVFELFFVYRMLTKRSVFTCLSVSLCHMVGIGYLPAGAIVSWANIVIMLLLSLGLRPQLHVILDYAFLYFLLNSYGVLVLLIKFGNVDVSYGMSFFYNVAAMIDYKLFIVSVYLFTKYKGGFRLWKTMKRPLLS